MRAAPHLRLAPLAALLALAACDAERAPARIDPYDPPSPAGLSGALDPPDGTVPMDTRPTDAAAPVDARPAGENAGERGAELYGVFCAPCHGDAGRGDGPVRAILAEPPPSLVSDALRRAGDAHILRVIERGQGSMYPYRGRVTAAERADILAFLRRLQAAPPG